MPSETEVWTNDQILNSATPTYAHALGAGGYRPVQIGRMHLNGLFGYKSSLKKYMPYFNISMGKSAISLLIRREFLNYLNTLQGKDKFPGRATIKADSLEKHQYSEAINPKRFKSKYAQKYTKVH